MQHEATSPAKFDRVECLEQELCFVLRPEFDGEVYQQQKCGAVYYFQNVDAGFLGFTFIRV